MCELNNIDDAVKFIETYDENSRAASFQRFEIRVRYNNGNEIEGKFNDKVSAIDFLRVCQPVPLG